MATENLNQATAPRTLWAVTNDLCEVQNYLRISQELAMDELDAAITSDAESVEKLLERMFFIFGQFPEKITQMDRLIGELSNINRAGMLQAA